MRLVQGVIRRNIKNMNNIEQNKSIKISKIILYNYTCKNVCHFMEYYGLRLYGIPNTNYISNIICKYYYLYFVGYKLQIKQTNIKL